MKTKLYCYGRRSGGGAGAVSYASALVCAGGADRNAGGLCQRLSAKAWSAGKLTAPKPAWPLS